MWGYTMLITQPSLVPTRKVGSAAAFGMFLAPLIVFLWNTVAPHNPIPEPAAAVLGSLVAVAAAYVTKERRE